jgi:hypothetical protein
VNNVFRGFKKMKFKSQSLVGKTYVARTDVAGLAPPPLISHITPTPFQLPGSLYRFLSMLRL